MHAAVWICLTAGLLGWGLIGPAEAQRLKAALEVTAAAEQGDARAQVQLGLMHERGVHVPQDFHLAAMWYHRAAEQGDPRGQHRLGLLYNKGFGVPIDLIEAYKWLNLAATRVRSAERDYYARMRNAVRAKLTYSEMAEAQRRSSFWLPKPER